MSAVVETRTRLAAQAQAYSEAATAFLLHELDTLADESLTKLATLVGHARCRRPDHSSTHARTHELAPLVKAVAAVLPAVLPTIRGRYCASINTCLRKELRLYSAELRRLLARAPEPMVFSGTRKAYSYEELALSLSLRLIRP